MSVPKHTKIGLIDLDAYADGEPLTYAHIRQPVAGTNALADTVYTAYSHAYPSADFTAINARANDTQANYYDLLSNTYRHVAPYRRWELAMAPIKLKYPPGRTFGYVDMRVAHVTDATTRVRFYTSKEHDGVQEISYDSDKGFELSGTSGPSSVANAVPLDLDPSGEDILYVYHSCYLSGSEFTGSTVGTGGGVDISEDDWFDSALGTVRFARARQVSSNVYARPVSASSGGQNLQDLGAVFFVKSGGGFLTVAGQQITTLQGGLTISAVSIASEGLFTPGFTRREKDEITGKDVELEFYETGIWCLLSMLVTV